MPVAYLLGCLVAGAGMTWLSGLALDLEERVAYGAVVGAMVTTLAAFLAALAVPFGAATSLAGLAVAGALSAAGWWRGRALLGGELASLAGRAASLWPFWLLLAACWAYTLVLMAGAYRRTASGLDVWSIGVYSDWAAHLTYAGSFAFGRNFPPEFPIDPGHRLAYPFMVDFLAASLVPLGASLTAAMVLTSGYLLLALPAVMFLAGRRLVGGVTGPAAGVLVFLLGGGLGFTQFFADLGRLGGSALQHLPRLYTQDPDRNLQWLNPVLAYLLPQRSVLFGLAVALIAAAVLRSALGSGGRAPFLATGVLVGVTPLFHVHGYGSAVALAAAWAVFDRRRQWALFFLPALALGLPALAWLLAPGSVAVRWQVGWLAAASGHHDSWAWFWLHNTGLFIPLLLAAQAWFRAAAAWFAPLWLWFLVPNFVVLQPWDWDNTKFFVFWYALGALVVGALLARLAARGPGGRSLAAVLGVVLCLSGALDLDRLIDPAVGRAQFTDAAGLRVADWVRSNTEPRAVFLVAPVHNEPVPALGGRRVVAGYPGWLWTYGLADWQRRTQDAESMLQGRPGSDLLARRYGVGYVVIGPAERALGAQPPYWQARGRPVFRAGSEYIVYRLS